MAVYTEIDEAQLGALLQRYKLGCALSVKGIAEGVENSNYLLGTETGQYILTLYERRVKRDDLPYFLGLMDHLAAKGLACPTPIASMATAAMAAKSSAISWGSVISASSSSASALIRVNTITRLQVSQ